MIAASPIDDLRRSFRTPGCATTTRSSRQAPPGWQIASGPVCTEGSTQTAAAPGHAPAQSGVNKLGSYHCWNRVYDVATGRWTTPDPVMRPWTSLFSYVGSSPVDALDQTGLSGMSNPLADLGAAESAISELSDQLEDLQKQFELLLSAKLLDEAEQVLDEMDRLRTFLKMWRKIKPKPSAVAKYREHLRGAVAGRYDARQHEREKEAEIRRQRKEEEDRQARYKRDQEDFVNYKERKAAEERNKKDQARRRAEEEAKAAEDARLAKRKRKNKCDGGPTGWKPPQIGWKPGSVCLKWNRSCLQSIWLDGVPLDALSGGAATFACEQAAWCRLNGMGSSFSSYSPGYCWSMVEICLGTIPAAYLMNAEIAPMKCCVKWS